MENPILSFRRSKGWSRAEFLRRSGLSYQTLRSIEIGETKQISLQTKEYLSFVGLGENIQDQLNIWHHNLLEARRNGTLDSFKC